MSSKNVLRKNILFVVSAPAGAGKTTLVQMLQREFLRVQSSISSTTRKPRAGEIDGKDYHFLEESEFLERLEAGDFLEHVHLFGNYYGTSRSQLQAQHQSGSHVVLTIDTQGALQVKKFLSAVFIFIAPPSIEELHRRLVNRNTESEESLARRIAWAEKELLLIDQYDYRIVNDNLEDAYLALKSIVIAEEHRI